MKELSAAEIKNLQNNGYEVVPLRDAYDWSYWNHVRGRLSNAWYATYVTPSGKVVMRKGVKNTVYSELTLRGLSLIL